MGKRWCSLRFWTGGGLVLFEGCGYRAGVGGRGRMKRAGVEKASVLG